MGTGWEFRRKSLRRPKKTVGERRQKERKQKKRLIAMGLSSEKAMKLNGVQIRNLLRNPKKIKQQK